MIFVLPSANFHAFTIADVDFGDFHACRCEFSCFFRIFTLQGEKLHVFRDFHVLGVEFRVFTFSRGQIPFLRPNDSNGLRPCFSNPNGSPGRQFRKQRLAVWAAGRGPDPSFTAMVFEACDRVLGLELTAGNSKV